MRRPALALPASFALAFALAATAWASDGSCPDAAAPMVVAQLDPGFASEPRPARRPAQETAPSGPIIALPHAAAEAVLEQLGGEALLVLPKRADGTLPTGYEFAEGVRIVSSFWSPVLCSTVTRLAGEPELAPARFVRNLPGGASLVPNHVYTTASAAAPDAARDPYRELQHGLDRLGVDAALAVSAGAGARVAVLDSAPDVGHRELAGVRLVEIEDGPSAEPALHGSLTVGVIAAAAGNGYGIAGAAPRAELIAVPVCAPRSEGAPDTCLLHDLLRGIDAAIAARAQVLNLSFAGPPNPLLERAVRRLDQLGMVVVAAAGNEGSDEPRYPAAYPTVIGVGASDAEGRPAATSNRGLSAEIWAPGDEVLSTVPGDAFAFASGTSFAAAHVSGALAVLIGGGASPDEARRALFHAARSGGDAALSVAPLCEALARLGPGCQVGTAAAATPGS